LALGQARSIGSVTSGRCRPEVSSRARGRLNLLEQLTAAPFRACLDTQRQEPQIVVLRHARIGGKRGGSIRPVLALIDALAFGQSALRGLVGCRELRVRRVLGKYGDG
jgi:hypothetical protein